MRSWLAEHGNQILVGLIVAGIAGLVGIVVREVSDDDSLPATATVDTTSGSNATTVPSTGLTPASDATIATSTTPPDTPTTDTATSTTTTSSTTTSTTTTTTLPPTFLEKLRGSWTLMDWRERPPDPVTLGMDVLEGSLVVDAVGNAYWDLDLDDGGPSPPITPGVLCMGVVDQGSQELAGVPGRLVVDGQDLIGTERDWTNNLLSLRGDVGVAFCGRTVEPESNLFVYDTTFSAYGLEFSAAADDAQTLLLTMRNAAGTFTWRKAA